MFLKKLPLLRLVATRSYVTHTQPRFTVGRKDFSDKLSEKVTPDSQKSTLQKGKESVTDAVDHAASNLTPSSEKSTTQKAADQAHTDKKAAENQGNSLLDSAKDMVNQASDYITGNDNTRR